MTEQVVFERQPQLRCLRLHQGTRRTQPRRNPRTGCRSPLCGPPSSSRRSPNRCQAGFAASAWPSRSSPPTPGPSQRVPRGARGCDRRHPRRPRGSIDPRHRRSRSAHQRAIRRARAQHHPDRIGIGEPLKYGQMVDLVQAYFSNRSTTKPPISVPDWTFPGNGRVTRQLNRAKFALTTGERILDALPLRGKQAEIGADLEQQKEQLDRAGSYVHLRRLYRMRGDLPARPHVRLGTASMRRISATGCGSPVDRLAPLRPRHPIAFDGQDGPPQDAAERGHRSTATSGSARMCWPKTVTSPSSTSNTLIAAMSSPVIRDPASRHPRSRAFRRQDAA